MAKKAASARELALTTLADLLANPEPRVLFDPKRGIFKGTKAKFGPAAEVAIENGWIEPTGAYVEMGAAKKKTRVETFRLTAKGIAEVVDQGEIRDQIARLQKAVDHLAAQAEMERAAASEHHAATALAIQTACNELFEKIQFAVGGLQRNSKAGDASFDVVQKTLEHLARVVRPVDVDALAAKVGAASPASAVHLKFDWGDQVVAMVQEQKRRNPFQLLTLPQIFGQLGKNHPSLTLGPFHEGMRRLHKERRVFLVPFTQALALLDDPENALYLDHEVKYYVDLPQR